MDITVELLTSQANYAIVQLPGRSYPGVVVQGDSLKALHEIAVEAAEAATGTDAKDATTELVAELGMLLQHYIRTLDSAGVPLPFNRPNA